MDAAFLGFKVEENHMVWGQNAGFDIDIAMAFPISSIKQIIFLQLDPVEKKVDSTNKRSGCSGGGGL